MTNSEHEYSSENESLATSANLRHYDFNHERNIARRESDRDVKDQDDHRYRTESIIYDATYDIHIRNQQNGEK